MPKFAERLRTLRTSKGLSQAEFAKQIKISKSSVNMYERGEREPGLETLERIADYFNVDLDYLLGKSEVINKSMWTVTPVDSSERVISKSLNVIKIAGRDGSFQERILSDDQLAALTAILGQMPDASDDL